MAVITNKIKKARKPNPKYTIIKELSNRFSPKYFSGEQISDNDINSILEAARWAPSARNWQPWYFYWAQNGSKGFDDLLGVLSPHNSWAKTANVLIVACYIDGDERGENSYAQYDLGASVLALVLQAQNLGYHVRQMGLFDKEKAKYVVKAKEHEQPFVIVAMGILGDYSGATEDLIQNDLFTGSRKTVIAKQLK